MKAQKALVLGSFVSIALLGACDAPGEGARALEAKREINKIVEGLEDFRAKNGRYPHQISEIGASTSDDEINSGAGRIVLFYSSSTDERYELSFKYYGPGSNTCSRDSEMGAGQWNCVGGY